MSGRDLKKFPRQFKAIQGRKRNKKYHRDDQFHACVYRSENSENTEDVAIALVMCLHDCLMIRYHRQFFPVATVEPEAMAIAIASAPALPNSIRGLSEYI